jgi:hypothetical protein
MSNITVGEDGNVNINLQNIKKISIDHITDVISHRVMRIDDLTIHDLEFINNGKCYLSYTKDGKIVACRITNMNTEANLEEGIFILKPFK